MVIFSRQRTPSGKTLQPPPLKAAFVSSLFWGATIPPPLFQLYNYLLTYSPGIHLTWTPPQHGPSAICCQHNYIPRGCHKTPMQIHFSTANARNPQINFTHQSFTIFSPLLDSDTAQLRHHANSPPPDADTLWCQHSYMLMHLYTVAANAPNIRITSVPFLFLSINTIEKNYHI